MGESQQMKDGRQLRVRRQAEGKVRWIRVALSDASLCESLLSKVFLVNLEDQRRRLTVGGASEKSRDP